MEVILATDSAGLIGSEVVRCYAQQNKQVAGIDNDMRKEFLARRLLPSETENHLKNLILRNIIIMRLTYVIISNWRRYSRNIKTQSRIEPIFFNTERAYLS